MCTKFGEKMHRGLRGNEQKLKPEVNSCEVIKRTTETKGRIADHRLSHPCHRLYMLKVLSAYMGQYGMSTAALHEVMYFVWLLLLNSWQRLVGFRVGQ